MYQETKCRSVVKAISWRIVGTIMTIAIVYVATRQALIAAAIGGVEVTLKMLIYFLHERAWNKIPYGRRTMTDGMLEKQNRVEGFSGRLDAASLTDTL